MYGEASIHRQNLKDRINEAEVLPQFLQKLYIPAFRFASFNSIHHRAKIKCIIADYFFMFYFEPTIHKNCIVKGGCFPFIDNLLNSSFGVGLDSALLTSSSLDSGVFNRSLIYALTRSKFGNPILHQHPSFLFSKANLIQNPRLSSSSALVNLPSPLAPIS